MDSSFENTTYKDHSSHCYEIFKKMWLAETS